MRCICTALDSRGVRALGTTVVGAKRAMGGDQGGSFQINEFGQVFVPASAGGGRRSLVGETHGSLTLENLLQDRTFTLGDDSDLTTGDPWRLPYLGMPFNVSTRNRVYFWREDEESGRSEYPPHPNGDSVRALRTLRPSGSIRFLVNPEGVVLTKQSPKSAGRYSDEDWDSVYVCRLELDLWFEKEE